MIFPPFETQAERPLAGLREKIHACWVGKAVGGTLGAPLEGVPGPLGLTFYEPVPTRTLPNDDLDLQVVWLHHLRTNGLREVTSGILAEAWEKHVLFPYDEYAIARRNRSYGLSGPRQGATDNFFGECMGGAIRSEIWACVAPGQPARAAGFAWADAVVDHAGDGVWAEVFNATLQSAAFVESDRDRLLDVALGFLPDTSQLKQAVRDTIGWWAEDPDWVRVRERVLEKYATGNFTHVTCNICFQLIGWFEGGDDFGRAICTAVNCGLDTDCTGATLGALLGILRPDSIPDSWRKPIGEEVVLSEPIIGVIAPRDLTELTEWTLEVAAQLEHCTPAIGVIAAHRPVDADSAVRPWSGTLASISELSEVESSDRREALLNGGARVVVPGAWLQFPGGAGRLMAVEFESNGEEPLKVMVFSRGGAVAWIDGAEVLAYTADQIRRNPFAAPSFHRAGVAATRLDRLAPGRHVLVLAAMGDAGDAWDLVWGFATSADNLWASSDLVAPVVPSQPSAAV